MKPLSLFAALIAAVSACGPAALAAAAPDAEWRSVDPENLLVIDSSKGRILVEMSERAAPQHVARIRQLARQHFYDGQTFFRVIDRFMAQTGDPKNTGDGGSPLPNLKAEFTFRRSAGSAFVPVAWPAGAVVGFAGVLPVMSQPDAIMALSKDHAAMAWGLYCPGVAGMARDEDPDTANSQFFLMRQAYPSLEKRYTVWGRVVSGLDVVRAIRTGEPVPEPQDRMLRVRLASDLSSTERPNVRVLDTAGPAFKALVAKTRAARGADFSACDIDVPARVQ